MAGENDESGAPEGAETPPQTPREEPTPQPAPQGDPPDDEITDEAAEAAFLKGFQRVRGGGESPDTPAAPESTPERVKAPESAPKGPKAAVPAAGEEEIFPGMTKRQVADALAQLPTLQQAVSRLGGHIGALKQQAEAPRAPAAAPAAPAAAPAEEEDYSQVANDYPDIAGMVRQMIKASGGAAQPTDVIGQIVAQVRTELRGEMERENLEREEKALQKEHPDWVQTMNSPAYALWLSAQPEDYIVTARKSASAAEISSVIQAFKDHRAGKTPGNGNAQRQAQDRARLDRFSRKPDGTFTSPQGGQLTDEQAFEAGFYKVRGRPAAR